ncbi:hypothetical protein AABB24_036446 [Solanum stoloniferum]|uniref:Uncharacterized protein n=1 Tax=Solanum stoloniferum TaxID=62892 RepID=A0ABD2RBZ0_9SOLN
MSLSQLLVRLFRKKNLYYKKIFKKEKKKVKEKKEEVNSVYIYDTLSKQYICLCNKLIAKNQITNLVEYSSVFSLQLNSNGQQWKSTRRRRKSTQQRWSSAQRRRSSVHQCY